VPLANVPQRISDLAAVQRGTAIIAHCTVPTFTTENNAIKTSVKLDLRIGVANDPFVPGDWANEAKPFSGFEFKDGIATVRIPTRDWTGKKVTIGVRSIGSNGKHSDWSNFETVPVVTPPEIPSKVDVQDTAGGEHITWTGAGDQFRVLRRAGDEKEYTIAATVSGHEWTDTGIEYGKPYTYEVQALVDAGDKKLAESDLSEAASRTPKDTFPPAVPAGLRADRTAGAVSLVWEPDSDSDLAGYRVYRSEGNGAWQKLADVNTVPSYSDATAEHGKTYRYAISAFDKTAPPNESDRSAAVEIAFP
jgi:fibronectin type 3 domain-containing protein